MNHIVLSGILNFLAPFSQISRNWMADTSGSKLDTAQTSETCDSNFLSFFLDDHSGPISKNKCDVSDFAKKLKNCICERDNPGQQSDS